MCNWNGPVTNDLEGRRRRAQEALQNARAQAVVQKPEPENDKTLGHKWGIPVEAVQRILDIEARLKKIEDSVAAGGETAPADGG